MILFFGNKWPAPRVMNPNHHHPPKKVPRGTRRCRSPDPIPVGVKNATTTPETTPDRSTKKAKLDDELTQALLTLPPLPLNYKPRTLCNPLLDQIMVKGIVARVGEYLLTFQTEDTTKIKNLDLDQLIHELDVTSNFLKNLTKRQVEQGPQTSPIGVPPLLVTPKP
jgi:hypothetical protein